MGSLICCFRILFAVAPRSYRDDHSARRKIRQREELISIIKKQLSNHHFFLGLAAVLIKVRLFLAQLRSKSGAAQDFSNMLFRFMD